MRTRTEILTLLPPPCLLVHVPRAFLTSGHVSRYVTRLLLTPEQPVFLSITANGTDATIITDDDSLNDIHDSSAEEIHFRVSEDRWRVFALNTGDAVGNSGQRVREVSEPLARAGISILWQSSYMADYILVQAHRVNEALDILARSDFKVESPYEIVPQWHSSASNSPTRSKGSDPTISLTRTTPSSPASSESYFSPMEPKSVLPLSFLRDRPLPISLLSPELAMVGLSNERANHWTLRIIRLLLYPLDVHKQSTRSTKPSPTHHIPYTAPLSLASISELNLNLTLPISVPHEYTELEIGEENGSITDSAVYLSDDEEDRSRFVKSTDTTCTTSPVSTDDEGEDVMDEKAGMAGSHRPSVQRTETFETLNPHHRRRGVSLVLPSGTNATHGPSSAKPNDPPARPSRRRDTTANISSLSSSRAGHLSVPFPANRSQSFPRADRVASLESRGPDTAALPFFSFTRTQDGTSLTTDTRSLSLLFPPGEERGLIQCADELDTADQAIAQEKELAVRGDIHSGRYHQLTGQEGRYNRSSFGVSGLGDDDDDDDNPGTFQCVEVDLREFELDKHGLVTSLSELLNQKNIDHLFMSTARTTNILVSQRDANVALSLLTSPQS